MAVLIYDQCVGVFTAVDVGGVRARASIIADGIITSTPINVNGVVMITRSDPYRIISPSTRLADFVITIPRQT